MRRVDLRLLACVVVIGALGCDTASDPAVDVKGSATSVGSRGPASGGVAIVDLDEVAKRLGRDIVMSKAIENGQASLNQQLQKLQVSLNEQYEAKKFALNAQPPQDRQAEDAQVAELGKLERQFSLQLAQARRSAQSEINSYGRRLIQQFRAEVKPIAQEVAAGRGLSVVVTKNESVLLSFDPADDITDEVVEALRQRTAASGAAAATTAALPGDRQATRR